MSTVDVRSRAVKRKYPTGPRTYDLADAEIKALKTAASRPPYNGNVSRYLADAAREKMNGRRDGNGS